MGETLTGVFEDTPCLVEAREKGRTGPAGALRQDALGTRGLERACTQMVGAQRLAAEGAREQLVGPIGRSGTEASEEALERWGSDAEPRGWTRARAAWAGRRATLGREDRRLARNQVATAEADRP